MDNTIYYIERYNDDGVRYGFRTAIPLELNIAVREWTRRLDRVHFFFDELQAVHMLTARCIPGHVNGVTPEFMAHMEDSEGRIYLDDCPETFNTRFVKAVRSIS